MKQFEYIEGEELFLKVTGKLLGTFESLADQKTREFLKKDFIDFSYLLPECHGLPRGKWESFCNVYSKREIINSML